MAAHHHRAGTQAAHAHPRAETGPGGGEDPLTVEGGPVLELAVGTGRVVQQGEEVAILSIGHIGNYAVEVCKNLKKGKHAERKK